MGKKLSVQPRRHHCSSSSLLALNHLYRIIPTKMSETEVKTDAPTAEEIKGTKRTAEEEVDAAKKQKTENGANGANGKAVEAEENGEGEEDLDEEAEGEEGEGEEDGEGEEEEEGDDLIFFRHPTSSFRTTYTKYATSSSSLLSKSKKRSTATVRKKTRLEKRAKCQTNPLLT